MHEGSLVHIAERDSIVVALAVCRMYQRSHQHYHGCQTLQGCAIIVQPASPFPTSQDPRNVPEPMENLIPGLLMTQRPSIRCLTKEVDGQTGKVLLVFTAARRSRLDFMFLPEGLLPLSSCQIWQLSRCEATSTNCLDIAATIPTHNYSRYMYGSGYAKEASRKCRLRLVGEESFCCHSGGSWE
jgi:hypothetical protein